MRAFLIFIVLLFEGASVLAQDIYEKPAIIKDHYAKFDRLTKKEGLSSNYILDILQDKNGFIWIATLDGLNRYDGKNFKQYKHNVDDPKSISDNKVLCISEDNNGYLWAGTGKGLNKYNEKSESFEKVFYIDDSGKSVVIDWYIRALFTDEDNTLWFETAKGDLVRYNSQSNRLKRFHHKKPGMINTYFYHNIFKENDSILWVGGRFMGIYRFNMLTGDFFRFTPDKTDKTKKRENDVAVYYSNKKNIIWIGGTDGLYILNTKTGIFDKILTVSTFTVEEDIKGNLWFGTGAGIYLFEPAENTFTVMENSDNNPFSLVSNHINKIFIDKSKNIWIGTIDGISIFRPSKNKFKHIYHIPEDEMTVSSSKITSILQLQSGEIWVGTENKGIDRLNGDFVKTGNISNTGVGDNSLNSNKISVLMQDKEGDVWAGQWSGKGFNIIDPVSFKMKSYSFLNNSLIADWYNDIFEDSKGNIWIGLWGASGLYLFDKKRGAFKDNIFFLKKKYPETPVKKISFDGKRLWLIFDRQTEFFSLDPVNKRLSYYMEHNSSLLTFNRVLDVVTQGDGKIFFKTNDGNYYGKANPYLTFTKVNDFPSSGKKISIDKQTLTRYNIDVDTVLCELKDKDNNIWLGTFKGIYKLNGNKPELYLSKASNKKSAGDTIWSMAFDNSGNLWLATEKGLCELDMAKNKIITFKYDKAEYLSSHLITCIAEDREGRLWVGTTGKGINRLDPATGKAVSYKNNLEDSLSFWGKGVTCIYVSSKGTIWAGGYGLNKYDTDTRTFSHFTEANGLSNNTIMGILEDDYGRLWISTLNGLNIFNPRTGNFIRFYDKDGLQDNEFSNAACKLTTGELAFGGKNGISVCNPDDIFLNDRPPDLSILSFRIFDKKIDNKIFEDGKVELNYDENFFSIEYASLDFSNPDNIKYAYKLEGADKDWIYTDAGGRKAKYTNIDPGDYRFRVKASNGDGIWNEAGIFIDITVKPPFWKTYWFLLLEILALVFVVILIIKYREKKILEENKFHLLEQKLLRSQMNPHFIFNSLSSIQSFIFENNPVEAGSYLSRFAALIRSILYNSREEFISIEKEVETLNNYFLLQQLRYSNKFEYVIDIDPEIRPEIISIPPMLAQPFIENAIEHGIKHIKGQGRILVSFKLLNDHEAVMLTVEDNGIGIAASKKLQNSKKKDHTSLATVIANERIEVLNKGKKRKHFFLSVEDIIDSNGVVTGTKVKFVIPFRKQIV